MVIFQVGQVEDPEGGAVDGGIDPRGIGVDLRGALPPGLLIIGQPDAGQQGAGHGFRGPGRFRAQVRLAQAVVQEGDGGPLHLPAIGPGHEHQHAGRGAGVQHMQPAVEVIGLQPGHLPLGPFRFHAEQHGLPVDPLRPALGPQHFQAQHARTESLEALGLTDVEVQVLDLGVEGQVVAGGRTGGEVVQETIQGDPFHPGQQAAGQQLAKVRILQLVQQLEGQFPVKGLQMRQAHPGKGPGRQVRPPCHPAQEQEDNDPHAHTTPSRPGESGPA